MLPALALALALATTRAAAQIDPDDSGAGDKLGMTQRNNSGQVGTVTIYRRGPGRAFVVVALFSEPRGSEEPAAVRRGGSCASLRAGPVRPLAPVVNGRSRTILDVPASALLSGGYVVAVAAAPNRRTRLVSCGELYR